MPSTGPAVPTGSGTALGDTARTSMSATDMNWTMQFRLVFPLQRTVLNCKPPVNSVWPMLFGFVFNHVVKVKI